MSQYAITVRRTKRGEIQLEMATEDGRVALSNGGKTAEEAARWLLRHAHRLCDETEQALLDLKLLTQAEADHIVEELALPTKAS